MGPIGNKDTAAAEALCHSEQVGTDQFYPLERGMMMKLASLKWLPLLLAAALVFGGCGAASAPAAAPAGSEAEAAPAEALPEAAEQTGSSDTEAPQVSPADQAPEATSTPAEGQSQGSASATQRLFAIVPEQSQAQYAVEEEFFGQAVPFVNAVGTTDAIDGSVTLDFADGNVSIANSTFTVDISTLTSDSPRRDRAIRDRWLESSRFPLATFVATGVENMPEDSDFGQDVSFQVVGDMTVRDVTQPLTWDMTARLDGETLTGSASTFLLMRDFGFEPPDIAGILKVTDGVTVTVQFAAQEVK
jgi:polyisoprenoid-binding protein YceI